jgi:signal transduction histidine kinase
VTQELFSLTLHARTTLKSLDRAGTSGDDPVRQQVKIMSDLAQGALAEMRMLIFELRPGALAEEGLVTAVRKLAASVGAREGLEIDVEAPSDHLALDDAAEEHVYRLIQEALNNVVKHAGASRVDVRMCVQDSGELIVTIRDNGQGFDPAMPHPGHLGLETMAARASELGGDYEVTSAPGVGTTVRVTLPARGAPPDRRNPIAHAQPVLSR